MLEYALNLGQFLIINELLGVLIKKDLNNIKNLVPLISKVYFLIHEQSAHTDYNLIDQVDVLGVLEHLCEHVQDSADRVGAPWHVVGTVLCHAEDVHCSSFHLVQVALDCLDELLAVVGYFLL
jgi:hypothetical protein